MKHDVATAINWPEWPVYGCNFGRPERLTAACKRRQVPDQELLVLDTVTRA